jgi:hypothetical protein
MLQTQTVEPGTLSLLETLMYVPVLKQSYLVGGTALSLLYGHRISIDLDLFYHDDLDKTAIIQSLTNLFKIDFDYRGNPNSLGIFCNIRNEKLTL